QMHSIIATKQKYSTRRGEIRNQQKISEYSITVNREVIEDNRNARHFITANIRSGVKFDLKKGLTTFIHKGDCEIVQAEPRLYPLCQWAVVREGETLEQVFDGVDFASSRGTFKRIAASLMKHNFKNNMQSVKWTVVALKFGNVILLSEEKIDNGNSSEVSMYSGYKFEQYMTSDRENGTADTTSPVDNRKTYEKIVKSELVSESATLKILCDAEIDAVRGDEPMELKTAVDGKETALPGILEKVLQIEIAGVKRIVFGLKNDKSNYMVHRVIDRSINYLKDMLNANNGVQPPLEGQCYAFLSDILTDVKQFMKENEVCEIRFDPYKAIVEIKAMTKGEAKARGHVVTQDFINKFNLNF
ncbi:hypothetical protein PMAYCL1PPCAC_00782, partial [Pristionchus mayeri]